MSQKFHPLDLDDNVSVWVEDNLDYQPRPSLKQNITADLAIIGGGFTGVSTAYHFSLRYPEKRVVLLEAKTLGNGASGRNGGQMLNWGRGGKTDDAGLQRNYQVTSRAIDTMEAIVREHKLIVGFRRDGVYKGLTTIRAAERAHIEVEYAQRLGIPLIYLDQQAISEKLGARGFYGAVLDPTEGQINGAQYVRALREILIKAGVAIYENTPVLDVTEGAEVRLDTPDNEVRAKAILLATNAYTHYLGYFRYEIFPAHSLVLATAPLSTEQLENIGWKEGSGLDDDFMLLSYLNMTPDKRVLIGGTPAGYKYTYNNRTAFPGSMQSLNLEFQKLYQTLQAYFPDLSAPVTHRWTGPVALNMNSVSGMMGVRGEYKNIYYALGYCGHGVVLANLAGELITDLYSHNDEKWRGLPFYQPQVFPIPPEPFRWVGANLYIKSLAPFRNQKIVFGG